ncbi:MAG: hypothetical protein KDA84_16305 [Planctomycetaceae bacterium]|nr:hypothetical protein [Planctomycetaceae bacterium]
MKLCLGQQIESDWLAPTDEYKAACRAEQQKFVTAINQMDLEHMQELVLESGDAPLIEVWNTHGRDDPQWFRQAHFNRLISALKRGINHDSTKLV